MRLYKLSINTSDYDVLIKEVTPEEVIAEVNGELKSVRIREIENLGKSSTSAAAVFAGSTQQTRPSEPAPQPKPAPKPEVASQPKSASKPEPAPQPKPAAKPEPAPQPKPAPQAKPEKSDGAGTAVVAPIPGQIYSVSVSEGDKVLTGQTVLILEAMKMENVITANCDGVVDKVLVKVGDTVEQNQQLVIIK